MNRNIGGGGCSIGETGLSAIHLNTTPDWNDASLDFFACNLGFSTLPNDSGQTSFVSIFHNKLGIMRDLVATNDLTSTVRENGRRFRALEEHSDPCATSDYNISYEASVSTTANTLQDGIAPLPSFNLEGAQYQAIDPVHATSPRLSRRVLYRKLRKSTF